MINYIQNKEIIYLCFFPVSLVKLYLENSTQKYTGFFSWKCIFAKRAFLWKKINCCF